MMTKIEQLRLAVELIALGNRISRGLGSPEQLRRLALIAAAPQLLEALRPYAMLGLWEDNYPVESEEYAEARASNSRLDVWVFPEELRAARAAIAAAGD